MLNFIHYQTYNATFAIILIPFKTKITNTNKEILRACNTYLIKSKYELWQYFLIRFLSDSCLPIIRAKGFLVGQFVVIVNTCITLSMRARPSIFFFLLMRVCVTIYEAKNIVLTQQIHNNHCTAFKRPCSGS